MSITAVTPLLSAAAQRGDMAKPYSLSADSEIGLLPMKKPITEDNHFWLWKSHSYPRSIAALLLLLIVFTCLELVLLRYNLPSLDPTDKDTIKIPSNLEELRRLKVVLSVYMEKHFGSVYTTFFITYIYLQSFSVPGSMWLSILGGALFPFWLALLTVSLCSAVGSCIAFLISGNLGSVAITHLIGDRLIQWNEQLVQHKQHMLNYMIVLRVAPLPPNWMVNLGAPHLHVPLNAFFWGTFIGVACPSFLHVQAGAALDRLSSSDQLNLLTWTNVICLAAVAIVALVPVLIRRRYPL
ncbi:snare associated Golgi protein-domain-containing protein [Spinellus fusiger]|nr:snare associated Golgi protein-domain-containing protein [Spinellus fusiger]